MQCGDENAAEMLFEMAGLNKEADPMQSVVQYIENHVDEAEHRTKILSTLQKASRLDPELVRDLMQRYHDLGKKLLKIQLEMGWMPLSEREGPSERSIALGREISYLLMTLKDARFEGVEGELSASHQH